ncbi:3-deoxy-D-manno-octulosonic acid transferase [Thalassobaculum fulvum]|uniref:3-deoxy-D-manno-octulosonic acid transferase n=1 Tax=Thalassobaculum fulvum TaxID=1633335 RepID=A0A918XUS3_9PROT|nr:3-deoxy-D-manno-octulosonic acid transferase [Thalassobaculum fulvum]GHD55161.1 3-deoxy-D-manno-octulosonic acid transferase [Thalassobaculum fulvum]
MLALYRGAATALGPLIDAYLRRRIGRGKEDPARLEERRGVPGRARPNAPLVWLHAASVGESVALLPLIERLRTERPGLAVLVTTGTVTSAATMARRLPDGAIHQFVPVDRPAWVRRFLAHWRPEVGIWVESDLWPSLVTEAAAAGVRLALVDARMSDGAFRRWHRFRRLARPLFAAFERVLASSPAQAERFRALGFRDVRFVGNLKAAGAPPPVDATVVAALTGAIAGRPVWLAANTHPGEDEVVFDAHSRLAASRPRLLTVVAPRHPDRGKAIAELAAGRGLAVARRSLDELPSPDTAVYVADTLGEMGALYASVPITFLAGSLVPVGGHNPIEPAHAGTALLLGPLMPNNRDSADALIAAGAARPVADAASIAAAVGALLDDPDAVRAMAEAARRVAVEGRRGLDHIVDALAPLLPGGPDR